MALNPQRTTHGYRLASQRRPGAGVSAQSLSGAPLLTRVSSIFSVGEPIRRGTHQAPVDVYTLAHAATGSLLGFGRAPWWAILGIAVGWSGLGYLAQRVWPAPVAATSMQNLVADSAALVLGWAAAKAWIEGRLEQSSATREEVVVAPEEI